MKDKKFRSAPNWSRYLKTYKNRNNNEIIFAIGKPKLRSVK